MENIDDCVIDKEGRLVKLWKGSGGESKKYYIGPDAEGVIMCDEIGEFVEVGNEKRYWRGIIEPLPRNSRLLSLPDFTLFILKPDGMRNEMGLLIESLIRSNSCSVVATRDLIFDSLSTRKMYPYFFTNEWEKELVSYMTDGASRCYLIKGKEVQRKMFMVRNQLRQICRCDDGPIIRNFVHCADNKIVAIREALLVFSLEELLELVA